MYTSAGNISATPTVFADAIYFPDWGGNINAVRRDNGQRIWTHAVSDYDGVSGAISRDSPAVSGNDLVFGDIESGNAVHNGANIIAVSRTSGALHWITQVDTHPAAIITGPPVIFRNTVFVGVSSSEESLATDPSYPCCTFRGSVVALDVRTGKILWKVFTVPDNGGMTGGYSGNAVWQPPAIDPSRGVLYIGTGNNYTVPAAALACAEAGGSDCTVANDYFDTALALDLQTGAVHWANRLQGFDVFTVDCIIAPDSCPAGTAPDFDFGGSGPNLLPTFVGLGQKSGIYWALDLNDGHVLWKTTTGPGGTLGGIEWGTATDQQRVYTAVGNNGNVSYTLLNGQTINWGSWSGLDVATGKLLWQTADPTNGAMDLGSVSVANGVVYAGSTSGSMYAMDALSGKILWSFASGGSVIDGPSVVDGVVYWGSGYRIGTGGNNNKLYAFTVQ
ncbi:MAG TPA: PQQ-binding-like beta-propeller repeat protein [Candidatus Sulfopaludibacter sp.]|nr:PQQ-binding-like beta-propeller repeat protein [Candidatus Sulfopaludibacter sp.]